MVNEELDPKLPVHSSGRILGKNVLEMEDANYKREPVKNNKKKKSAPKRLSSTPQTDEDESEPHDSFPAQSSKKR